MSSSKSKDLTQGNPLKLLSAFVLPMLIGNIVQQLYSMADSIIIGRFVGKGPFAAIGATMPVLSVMIVVIIGFTMGIAITTARSVGAGDTERVRNFGISFAEPVLKLLKTPADILKDARTYLVYNFATCIGPIAYNMFSNILRSAGDSRTPLNALIISSVLNILLDLLFVLAFHWDVAGVALATGISQIISAVYCILVIRNKNEQYWCRRVNVRFHGRIILDILKYGMPVAASNLFTSLGAVFIQSLINGYGTTVVAGYTAANKLDQLALSSVLSVGNAASTFAGQNTGAGKLHRVRDGVRSAWTIGTVVSVVFGLALYFGGSYLVRLFISGDETETINVAVTFFKTVAPFYLLSCGMQIYLNTMRGMGEVVVPMAGSLTELVSKIAAAFLLSRALRYQTLWYAWPVGWLVAFLVWAFIGGSMGSMALIFAGFCLGFCNAPSRVGWAMAVRKVFGNGDYSKLWSYAATGSSIVGGFSTSIMGWTYDALGTYVPTFYAGIVVIVVIIICAFAASSYVGKYEWEEIAPTK